MIFRCFSKLACAAALLLLVACSSAPTFDAVTDHDAQYDFLKVRTLAMQPYNRLDPATVQVSDMQVSRIEQALADELRRKGFAVADDPAEADLRVSWHLVTQEKTDVRSYNSMSYYNCWRCGPTVSDVSVRQYTQGTLIVDLIDPVRNQSVWRSVIQSRLNPEPDPSQADANRREAARAIFSEFPPSAAPAT